MTWAVLLPLILFSLFKIVVTCLPTGVVEWMFSKFEVHSRLKSENARVFVQEEEVEGEDKSHIVGSFNEATFLEKHYIWPGTEDQFLNPDNSGFSIVIDTKAGKQDIKLFLFCYKDRVDVVKQYKKKLISYSLRSENLQNLLTSISKAN